MCLSLQSAVLLVLLSFAHCQRNTNECLSNKDCPSEQLCAEFQCINPCLLNLCGNPVDCKVNNHIPVCACSSGFAGPLTGGSASQSSQNNGQAKVKRFRIFDDQLNWFGALYNCSSQGMALATVQNQREQDWLNYLLKQTYPLDGAVRILWMGGSDLHKEGEFVWLSTGQPINYRHFIPGEPNHKEGENCLVVIVGDDRYNGWNDDLCAPTTREYVCEYYE